MFFLRFVKVINDFFCTEVSIYNLHWKDERNNILGFKNIKDTIRRYQKLNSFENYIKSWFINISRNHLIKLIELQENSWVSFGLSDMWRVKNDFTKVYMFGCNFHL